ncbi:MAG: hypothetical protein ACE5H4_14115, partial [Candidatus Thorarchaeota archaeon]
IGMYVNDESIAAPAMSWMVSVFKGRSLESRASVPYFNHIVGRKAVGSRNFEQRLFTFDIQS